MGSLVPATLTVSHFQDTAYLNFFFFDPFRPTLGPACISRDRSRILVPIANMAFLATLIEQIWNIFLNLIVDFLTILKTCLTLEACISRDRGL